MSEQEHFGQTPQQQMKQQAKDLVKVIRKKKRLLRLFGYFSVAFILFHVLIGLFVSMPFSQTLIIERIRTVLEREVGLTVDVGYVSAGILPPRFTLEDVYLMRFAPISLEQKQKIGDLEELLSLPSMATASLTVDRIEIGLNLLAPLNLSLIESVEVAGLRFVASSASAYEELTAYFSRGDSENSKDGDWWPAYLNFLSKAPARVNLNEIEIEVGQISSAHYLKLRLEESALIRNSKNELAVLAQTGLSRLIDEEFAIDLTIDEVKTKLLVRPDRGVIVEEVLVKSGNSMLETQGSLHITDLDIPKGITSPQLLATLQVDARIEAALLELVGIDGQGTIRVSGELSTTRRSNIGRRDEPHEPGVDFDFNGRASWEKLVLDDFDVYTGSADFRIENMDLYASRLVVESPAGAKIEAAGRLTLADNFPFYADVIINEFPFSEMMKGFSSETQAIDFRMNSGDLRLVGQGKTADPSRVFELDFAGLVKTTKMFVPSISQSHQVEFPLPDCAVDLRLIVDTKGLNFDGSHVNCQDDVGGNIHVPKGRVVFGGGHTDFQVLADGFDLSKASYFTKSPLSGNAKIQGRIYTVGDDDDQLVVFDSAIVASNVSYFQIGPVPLETDLRIDGSGLLLSDSKFQFKPEKMNGLDVTSPEVFISFGDRPSRFHINLDGEIEALRHLAPGIPVLSELSGQVKDLEVDWLMNLDQLDFSNPTIRGSAESFSFGPLSGSNLVLDISCTPEFCARGKLNLNSVRLSAFKSDENVSGTLNFNFTRLSSDRITAGAEFASIPVSVGARGQWQGRLNSKLNVDGPLADLRPEGQMNLTNIEHFKQPIGSLQMNLVRAEQGRLRLSFEALFGQLSGQVLIPWSVDGRTDVSIIANKLDILLFKPETRVEFNLFSELTGSFVGTSPSLFSPGAFTSRNWIDRVDAELKLESAQVSTQGVRATIRNPVSVTLNSSKLRFDDLIIMAERPSLGGKSRVTSLVGEMKYDVVVGDGFATVEGAIDLGILVGLLPVVERADGVIQLDGRITFNDSRPSLGGRFEISGDSLRLKGFEPDFTSINGELNARGDRIEIVRLGAKKGEGSLDILGSIRFPFRADSESLELSLRTRLNRLQTRVPAPVFRSVDSVLSGNIELTGKTRPYLLSGLVVIDEARAYRDLNCDEIVSAMPENSRERINDVESPLFDFDVVFEANESIQFVTRCVRANLSSRLRIQGDEQNPRFSGFVRSESGYAQVLKAKFEIQRGDIIFDSPIAFDPRLDVQMVSQIDNYQLVMNIDGYSSSPRTSFWSDPSTTPWGAPIGQVEVLRMVSSGRAPQSPTAEGNTLASQVANYVYGTTALDESLSKAFARISAGLVDTVRLQPIIENGQTTWKASFTRSVGDRVNLGLDVEQSPLVNNQSLTGTLFLNPTVNILGGVDRKSNQSESYTEVSGGLRFTFGGQ